MKLEVVRTSATSAAGDSDPFPEHGQLKCSAQAEDSPYSAASDTTTSPGASSSASSSSSSTDSSDNEETSEPQGSILHPPDDDDDSDEESDDDEEEHEVETAMISAFLRMSSTEALHKEVKMPLKAVEADISAPVNATIEESDEVLRKLVLRAVRCLAAYKYSTTEIVQIVVFSCVYFRRFSRANKTPNTSKDLGYIMILLMYVAHTWCLDKHISPKAWHECLLQKYCSMQEFDNGVLMLCKALDWRLRVCDTLSLRMCAVAKNDINKTKARAKSEGLL